jgi:hypothetical protein
MSKTFVFDKHANHDLLDFPFCAKAWSFVKKEKTRRGCSEKVAG